MLTLASMLALANVSTVKLTSFQVKLNQLQLVFITLSQSLCPKPKDSGVHESHVLPLTLTSTLMLRNRVMTI